MLGRFLEISVYAPDIQRSLEFYRALGFESASVGEVWSYPYAVVTDGRLFIGLHGAANQESQSPIALTFVLPQLSAAIDDLERAGVHFDQLQLGAESFNQAAFSAPGPQRVNLLEARTFSPPNLDRAIATVCGYFSEYALPVRDAAPGRAFWEPLGFVALEEETHPVPRTTLTSDLINLGLYRTRALRQPVLVFEDVDMGERLARLRDRGFPLSDDMPDSLDAATNGILTAPEGTRLLLLQAEE